MCRRLRFFSAFITLFLLMSCFVAPQVSAYNENNSLSLTQEEKNYIESHKSVKVGYVRDRIPVSFLNDNGEADGISRHIFDRVSELSGLNFEYVALPMGDVTYDYLLGHNFDLITSVEYNEQNKKAKGILISEPYLSNRKVVVAKHGFEFDYNSKFSVAVCIGSQTLKKVLAERFPNFELKDYNTIPECFDAVNVGEADLVIQNQFVVEYWLSKPKYEALKAIPVIGLDDKLCFSAVVDYNDKSGVSQNEGQVAINILNKAIAKITDDETVNYTIQGVMDNQYNYELSDFIYRYRYSVILFVVAFIVILLLAIILIRQHLRISESRAEAKAKGQFLSAMSHEIRTPLNGLMGLNYLMSQKLNDKEKLSEYLKQSSVISKYLLSLINDILDSSKLQEKKMDLNIKPIDLNLITETVSSIERNNMYEKKLKYNVISDFKYPCVMGDEIRIQQVLLNLLDNARKFTPKGGKVEFSAKQEITKEKKVVTIFKVSDTGKGMSEEFQKEMFNAFSQELETVSRGNQGTGLGLSICLELAQLMGGDLTCVSQKGKGSTFTFTFASEPAEMPEVDEETEEKAEKSQPRVLVAEDNEINGEIILEMLKYEGFQADIVENGKKAVKAFSDSECGTYGIILMDLLMPEMDGFEASKAIRALDREDAKTVRIIACTANSFAEERDKAMACGMNDFVTKPIDVKVLMKKLHYS